MKKFINYICILFIYKTKK